MNKKKDILSRLWQENSNNDTRKYRNKKLYSLLSKVQRRNSHYVQNMKYGGDYVQELFESADVSITMNIYARAIGKVKRTSARLLDKVIGGELKFLLFGL